MKFHGYRDIKNTFIYIDADKIAYPEGWSDEFTGKVATTREEKLALIEAGFEFVSAYPDGTLYFRRRK